MKKLMALLMVMGLMAACNQAVEEPVAQAETSVAEVKKVNASNTETAPSLTTEIEQFSYAIGAMQGNRMDRDMKNMQDIKLDRGLLEKGFSDGINGKSTMSDEDIQKHLLSYQKKIQSIMAQRQAKEGEVAKAAGENFLKENGKKDGVTTTDSGLQYEIIKKGDGKNHPKAVDKVKVHYVGTLLDGTTFDSSVQRGQPAEFGLNQVIPGWTEGLQLMTKGGKFKFYLPSDLAYGARALPSIPAHSVLTFEVELLDINPGK